jgi:hypothetical protein
MTDRANSLLTEWAGRSHHRERGFVLDGIIDPDRWLTSPRKVLFLLKEAYSDPDKPADWDLRAAIRADWKGPKYQIWWNVSEWALAIQQTTAAGSPAFLDERWRHDALAESLLSSAIVNLKKSSGQKSSDAADLRDFVSRDGDLLREQIQGIRPDIILCGSTWPLVAHLWPDARQTHDRVWQGSDSTFIDFWHPANRYPRRLNYYALSFLMQWYVNGPSHGTRAAT